MQTPEQKAAEFLVSISRPADAITIRRILLVSGVCVGHACSFCKISHECTDRNCRSISCERLACAKCYAEKMAEETPAQKLEKALRNMTPAQIAMLKLLTGAKT